MVDLDKALATQLANIQTRSGKSLDELTQLVRNSGLSKHGELVAMLKQTLGMGHGDANTVVHLARQSASAPRAGDAPAQESGDAALDALHVGAKATLRPIHEALLTAMRGFGRFEEAPKKSYVSYRRAKQFCTVGPATNSRVEVGLNMKGVPATDRLEARPAGQMCQYTVRVTEMAQVDAELTAWLRHAYEAAG